MTDPGPARQVALAVDIGGTKADAALVTADGTIVAGSASRRRTGPESTAASLATAVRSVAAEALAARRPEDELVGIGIGSAGPVDRASGTVSPLNMTAAAGFDPAAAVRDLVPGPLVRVALDGACIALAEHRWGGARGATTALALVVSTGVGGGFIVNGMPVSGRTGNAGHIGQLRVRARDADDPLAGTVESLASGPNTVAWARRHGWTGTTGEELAVSYAAGDAVARAAVGRSATAVGEAIAAAATLLDLEVAVVGGGFADVASDYIDQVRASVEEAAPLPFARAVRVTGSGLHGDGPLLGAAALVLGADSQR
ncbi:glucokinase [Microbacterium ulmi]|nr:glucokinase [Microbacterium ulmi]